MQDKNFWNANWADWEEDFTPSPFAQKALALIKVKDFCDILDLGCGKGRNSLFFASHGLNVTAMDISDEALKVVDRLRHPKIKTVCADLATVDLGMQKYDAIFACLSLHYFNDMTTRQIIQKIHRALKSRGVFFIRCKSIKDRFYGIGEKIGQDMFFDDLIRHFFRPEYMRDILKDFETVAVCETKEDYFGPCAFVDAIATKASS